MARKLRAAPNGDGKDAKKKGRAKAAPLLPGSANDEVMKEFYDKALKAKQNAEKAVKDAEPYKADIKTMEGVFRAVLKDAKKHGVDPDLLRWRLEQRNRSIEEIDRETRARNRIARLTNLPVGTQLGFDDIEQKSVATAIEDANRPDSDEAAHQAGYDAGTAGKGITTNPYPLDSSAFDAFEKGWGKQQSERALSMGKKRNGEEARAH